MQKSWCPFYKYNFLSIGNNKIFSIFIGKRIYYVPKNQCKFNNLCIYYLYVYFLSWNYTIVDQGDTKYSCVGAF